MSRVVDSEYVRIASASRAKRAMLRENGPTIFGLHKCGAARKVRSWMVTTRFAVDVGGRK